MGDLGFPDLDQAMEIYRPLSPETVPLLDVPPEDEESAVVPAAALPRQLRGTLLAEALGLLRAGRAAEALGYVLGVANSVAVADQLRLSESESIPAAIEKAVRGIDRGLRELSAARAMPVQDVLDRTRPADLFRIGATLDDTLRRPPAPKRSAEDAEAGVDEPGEPSQSDDGE